MYYDDPTIPKNFSVSLDGMYLIWMFPKIVVLVPPKSSILIGFSIINHPFWGTLIFGNTHVRIPVDFFVGDLGKYTEKHAEKKTPSQVKL